MHITFYTFLLTLFLLISTPLLANNEKSDTNKVTIVTEHAPPLQYIRNGKISGLSTDAVNKALSKTSITAEFEILPWARAYKKALSEPNTLIYSMMRNPQREDKFNWLGVIGQLRIAFVSLNDRQDIKIDSLDDAKGHVIGLMRNDIMHEYLIKKGFKEGEHFVLQKDIESVTKLLFANKIDLMLVDPNPLVFTANKLGLKGENLAAKYYLPDHSYDVYLAANKNTHPQIIEKLTKALNENEE